MQRNPYKRLLHHLKGHTLKSTVANDNLLGRSKALSSPLFFDFIYRTFKKGRKSPSSNSPPLDRCQIQEQDRRNLDEDRLSCNRLFFSFYILVGDGRKTGVLPLQFCQSLLML